MSTMLGVAVVGLGVGEQHARAFAAHPLCRLVALHDIDRRRAESLAAQFDGCTVANSFQEILSRDDVNVVSLASYDDAHYGQVCAALDAGKHVFVEKPICRRFDELLDIKRRWSNGRGRLKLRSNLVLRAAPVYQWLRQMLRDGTFGRPYSFDGDYLYGRLHKITEGWRGEVSDYSVMEGGGIHLVDLMLWLTGERPTHVSSVGNRICTAGTRFRPQDFVAASFEFPSTLVGRVTANFGCVHRHHHVVRLFATQATFVYDDAGPRFHDSRDPTRVAQRLQCATLPAGKGVLIPDFVSAIVEDRDDRAETQSFFDGISICAAADKALVSGRKEEIVYA